MQPVTLALHPYNDVAHAAPVVEAPVQELQLRCARLEGEEAEGGAEEPIPLNIGHDEVARPESSRADRSSSFSGVSGFSRWASKPAVHVRRYATGSRTAVNATSRT